MKPVRDRLESILRLFAAGICVSSVGLLSSLTVQSPMELPLATVFFLVTSAGCAFIVFSGGLGPTTAAGLGAVIAVSISIAMANASQISAPTFAVFTLLTLIVMVVVGRIAGGAEPSSRLKQNQAQPQRNGYTHSRLILEDNSPVWRASDFKLSDSTLIGTITRDFCTWLAEELSEPKSNTSAANESLLQLNQFAQTVLRQRLHARHACVAALDAEGQLLTVDAEPKDEPITLSPEASLKLKAGQRFVQDSNLIELTSRTPHWVLPLPGTPKAALCVFGLSAEQMTDKAASSIAELASLLNNHLRGLKALREASSSLQELSTSLSDSKPLS